MKILFTDFTEYWEKSWCPNCKEPNWVYQYHSQKPYSQTYFACKCWNCKEIYWFGDKEEFNSIYYNEIEEEGIDNVVEKYLEYCDGKPIKELYK